MTPDTMGTAEVIRANARDLPLADDSVDLVVTSPPYFALRSYTDDGAHYAGQIGDEATPAEFVDALLEVTRECMRVLKPSGSLWLNLGDKYNGSGGSSGHVGPGVGLGQASTVYRNAGINGIRQKSLIGIPWRYALRCIDDLGLILRAEVIWSKPNGLPESVTDRVRRSHEQWFHFVRMPRYYSAVDEIREAHVAPKTAAQMQAAITGRKSYVIHGSDHGPARNNGEAVEQETTYSGSNPLGKLPGSVWTIPTEPLRVPDHLGVDHFAAFPTEWPKRIIRGWSPAEGTIVDPFGGTGTTAMVAKALGRHGITVDMSADYCRLAAWRTNDRDQLAKVLGIAKADQEPDNAPSLFDLIDGGAA